MLERATILLVPPEQDAKLAGCWHALGGGTYTKIEWSEVHALGRRRDLLVRHATKDEINAIRKGAN